MLCVRNENHEGGLNVPTAIDMARRLEPYNIGWFEEPVQPNSNDFE